MPEFPLRCSIKVTIQVDYRFHTSNNVIREGEVVEKRGETSPVFYTLHNFLTVVLWKGSTGRVRERKGVLRGESGREKVSYGESQGEKRCPMGRVRERKGVLRGESGREKVSYGESQGEKRCPMGRVRERKGVLWVESGREKVSYG